MKKLKICGKEEFRLYIIQMDGLKEQCAQKHTTEYRIYVQIPNTCNVHGTRIASHHHMKHSIQWMYNVHILYYKSSIFLDGILYTVYCIATHKHRRTWMCRMCDTFVFAALVASAVAASLYIHFFFFFSILFASSVSVYRTATEIFKVRKPNKR